MMAPWMHRHRSRTAIAVLSFILGWSAITPPTTHAIVRVEDEEENPVEGLRITAAGLKQFMGEMRVPDMRDAKDLYKKDVAEALADIDPEKPIDLNGKHQAARDAIIKLYQKGGFETVKALAKEGSISEDHSRIIAAVRNAMVHDAMTVMSGHFGEVRVNDFSTAPTAQSDIDQTFHPIKLVDPVTGKEVIVKHPKTGEDVTGAVAKREFNAIYERMFGIDPERMEVSSHAAEATIPDWRQNPDVDVFAMKLRSGAEALVNNPEAYFLEGAFRRQVDRRSYESDVPLFRIYRSLRTRKNVGQIILVRPEASMERTLARVEVYKNVPPEWRKGYAFGAAVGNMMFFQHHNRPEEVAERAKYLMRSVEDGMGSLALKEGEPGRLYFEMDDGDRRDMLRRVYPDADQKKLQHLYLMYQTAEAIRENRNNIGDQSVKEKALRYAMIGYLAENQKLDKLSDASKLIKGMNDEKRKRLTEDAAKWYQNQSRAVMAENCVRGATARIDDWLNPERIDPEKIPKEYRKAFTENPKKFKTNLQKAARLEVLYSFTHLERDVVKRIIAAEQRPSERRALEALRDIAELKRSLVGEHYDGFFKHAKSQAEAMGRILSRTHGEFATVWNNGEYTAPQKYTRMKDLAMSKLGYYRQGDVHRVEAEAAKLGDKWDTKKMAGHVFNLGNVDSVITIIRAGQDSNWDSSAIGWAVGFEVISNLKGVSPFLAVKGALFDGEFEGAAVLVAGYFVPVVGQIYMFYNIGKGSILILDFEISRGISDMVYQGYTPSESSGFWGVVDMFNPSTYITSLASATSMKQAPNVLTFVPGDTFQEQRKNLFKHYDHRIVGNLNTEGMDDDQLFEHRHRLAPAFFRKIVNQYCEQKGEFAEVFIPGGSLFRTYLDRPEVREGLIMRCTKDYLGGSAGHAAEEFQKKRLPEMERDADQAATLLDRCWEGVAAMGEEARKYLHIATGLPDFPELTDEAIDDMKPFVEVDKESDPIVEIEAPPGLMSAGDLWKLKGKTFVPPGRYYKPYNYNWTVQNLSEANTSSEPHEGLTLNEGWTRARNATVSLVVTDVMGAEIGKAETVIKFRKLVGEATGQLGTFSLMRVDETYYSSEGKKEGQALDLRIASYWIPMFVSSYRPYEKALAELTEELTDQQHKKPGDFSGWRNQLNTIQKEVKAGWALSLETKHFKTPFETSDVPKRKEERKPGGGPVW